MTEMNYIEAAYEIIDLLKSKGIDIMQTKEILSECNQIADQPTIRYIAEKLYNLGDICYAYNLNIEELINFMSKNNIDYVQDLRGNLYTNATVLTEMFSLSNQAIPFQCSSDEIKNIFFNKGKIHVKSEKIQQIESETKNETLIHERVRVYEKFSVNKDL